ncbi:MAG: hypothetical protein ABEJ28_10630 [Salinigranum sp.]
MARTPHAVVAFVVLAAVLVGATTPAGAVVESADNHATSGVRADYRVAAVVECDRPSVAVVDFDYRPASETTPTNGTAIDGGRGNDRVEAQALRTGPLLGAVVVFALVAGLSLVRRRLG